MRDPHREDEMMAVLSWVENYPGIWTAMLCRALNGLPETVQNIIHCGTCKCYANPRKRARAQRVQDRIFPAKIHAPCTRLTLRQLQHVLHTLEEAGMVAGMQLSVIPDSRNYRGWDYATRWWPGDRVQAARCPVCLREVGKDPALASYGRCSTCQAEIEAGTRCPICLQAHDQACPWMEDGWKT